MPLQVVACVTINKDEPDALAEYFKVTLPLMESVGARIVEKREIGPAVVGDSIGETLMVVEYPDYDALDRVFKSAAYKAIIPARDKAFLSYNVSVLDP